MYIEEITKKTPDLKAEHFCSDIDYPRAKKVFQFCENCDDLSRHILIGLELVCDECGELNIIKERVVVEKVKSLVIKRKLYLFLL